MNLLQKYVEQRVFSREYREREGEREREKGGRGEEKAFRTLIISFKKRESFSQTFETSDKDTHTHTHTMPLTQHLFLFLLRRISASPHLNQNMSEIMTRTHLLTQHPFHEPRLRWFSASNLHVAHNSLCSQVVLRG